MRFGKKREPHYRIVVTEARSKRQGMYKESVGTLNPLEKDKAKNFTLDVERVKYWLGQGVKPTDTVESIFAKKSLVKRKQKVKKSQPKRSGKQ